ncbi:hypothetical protein [Brachybacterium tyrofermentans]|uniref:hypothetical protein n=1 Tax=Brachybacterium tyrofermentans TaxID=47848 RepID=UPI001D032EF9|nr:hypothetical protein [Brachybacterium tyrofermentans]
MDEVEVVVAHIERGAARWRRVPEGEWRHGARRHRSSGNGSGTGADPAGPLARAARSRDRRRARESEASCGDALFDLAIVMLGQEDRLDDLLEGYGEGADRQVIRAWWSLRSLTVAHWLIAHDFDPNAPGSEFDVLRARVQAPSRQVMAARHRATGLSQPADSAWRPRRC